DIASFVAAGWFAHDAPADFFLPGFQRFNYAFSAVDKRAFLIAGNEVGQIKLRLRVMLQKALRSDNHCSQTAFHISSPTAIQSIANDNGFKRRRMPLFNRTGWHDIGMSCEAEYRSTAAATCPHIQGIFKMHDFDINTNGG